MAVISLDARVFSASVRHVESGVGPGNEVVPGVLGEFSQQALRLTSRQNSPGMTGDEAGA